jgi:RNA polymerase sigma factor for flagellar operon FliA
VNSPDIYLANRELIEDAIAAVCRRRRLASDEAEEFASDARLHFIKDDYAVLRSFGGRSSMRTFLIAVAAHLFLDWRNARWGKWRPSAEAKRLGPLAVKLETMIVRDRMPFDEAHETLRTNFGVAESRAALEALAARFPHRVKRSFLPDDALEARPAEHGDPSEGVAREAAEATAARARAALAASMMELETQDRLILEMRYTDGHRVQDIARLLNLEPKPLYRRLERTLAELRRGLERRGVAGADALEAIEHQGFLNDQDVSAECRGEVRPFPQQAAPDAFGSHASEGRRP